MYDRAVEREVQMAVYTEELFETPHDDANRAAVRAVPSAELRLVGLAMRGKKKPMEKVLKGLRLHG